MSKTTLLCACLFFAIQALGEQDNTLLQRISNYNVVKGTDLDTAMVEILYLQKEAIEEKDQRAEAASLRKVAQIYQLKSE